jgi:FkbM family methyltransferase
MGLLSKILRWLGGSSAPKDDPPPEEESLEGVDSAEDETTSEVVIYDENLYERARTQWQFGDWESLAQIEYESLIHHPQRARLALLVASGHQQRGDTDATREFTRLAREWGASKKLVSQVLIAGVYNTLGKASALCGQQQRAIGHFEQSLRTAGDGGDVRLLAEARGGRQNYAVYLNDLIACERMQTDTYGKVEPRTSHLCKEIESLKEKLTKAEAEKDEKHKHFINRKKQAEAGEGKIRELRAEVKNLIQERDSLKIKLKDLESYSSDADIDSFLHDIAPFYFNRHLTYVDVGAFVGEVFSKILKSGKIKIREAHLIEPNPESFEKLKVALESCSISSVHAYNFAVGCDSKKKTFSSARSMTKEISGQHTSLSVSNTFKSSVYKLEELSHDFTEQHIDLLKIDVEGNEIDVLESAKSLFESQSVDVVYIEVGMNEKGKQQTYFCKIDAWMQNLGYRVFKFYEQKYEWISDSPLLRRCNVAYMSEVFANNNPYKATVELHDLKNKLQKLQKS